MLNLLQQLLQEVLMTRCILNILSTLDIGRRAYKYRLA